MKVYKILHAGREKYAIIKNKKFYFLKGCPWDFDLNNLAEIEPVCLKNPQFLVPILPTKIIGVALNYPGVAHTENSEPLFFLKGSNSLVLDGDAILEPFAGAKTWGESELGIIVDIDHLGTPFVKGHVIANDVTCDHPAGRDHHLLASKSHDSFCAISKFIDLDFKPMEQKILGKQDGKVIREGKLSDRLLCEEEILERISKSITLKRGDLILTGAPGRVTFKKYLYPGARYTVEIEGLGEIDNVYRGMM